MISHYIYISLLVISALFSTGWKTANIAEGKGTPKDKNSTVYNTSNDSLLRHHEFIIINSRLDINKEENFVDKLPNSFIKVYLTGLIEKRKGNFSRSFDILFSLLNSSPSYQGYYDELVNLAEINNKFNLIREFLLKDTDSTSGNTEYLKALIFASDGEYKKAFSLLKQLSISGSSGQVIVLQLSNVQRNLGDYESSLKSLVGISKLAYRDPAFQLKIWNAEGALFYLSGNYKEAKRTYMNELQLARKIKASRYEAKALVNLGILLDEDGGLDSARAYYVKAVTLAGEINDLETKAFAFSELGVSYSFTGRLIESRNNYLISYELYRKLGNRIRLSFLSNNIGKIYLTMFNYYSALNYFEKGLEFAGENKRALILNLIGKADVYANMSNYTKALEYYEKAKHLSQGIRDVPLLTDVNIGLGTLNYNLNLTANAIKYFHAADDLCKSNGGTPFISAGIYFKCGMLYVKADSLDKAEKYFNRAVNFSRQYADSYTEISSLLELAEIYISRSQVVKAYKILQDIRLTSQIKDYEYLKAQKEITYGKLNILRKNFSEALRHFNNAKKSGLALHERNIQIETDLQIAKIFEDKKLFNDAEKFYLDAYKLVENVSSALNQNQEVQIAYFSSKDDVYKSLANLYISQGKFDKAFEVVESSRSRNTIQNLNNLMVQSLIKDNETLNRIYDSEWLLNSDFINPSALDSLRMQYDQFKQKLTDKEPRLKEYLGKKYDLRLSDIQKELSKDEYIFSAFSNETNTILFLISKNDFRAIKTNAGHKELVRLIGNISPYFNSSVFRTGAYYNQDLFSFNTKASYEFYQKIIEPVVRFIPEDSKLIIASSSELSILPFEFLVTKFSPNESVYNYKDKSFLVFKYNISYSPSASAYLKLKNSRLINSGQKLLIGDPSINYHSNAFAQRRGLLQENTPGSPRDILLLPLKYSKQEVAEINRVINADKVLLSEEATKENFKKYSKLSSIIHLSTHSFLYNEQPFIFFSNTNSGSNESFLEASEIAQLKLNSDLIVLSSCNSGLGLIDEAEGTLGMTKAFFESGAKSVVVSLWDVNDNYTSKLMALFYQKLNEGYSKSEALRQAKIIFIKKYSANPYFWAAFVLSGDTSNLQFISHAGFSIYFLLFTGIILLTAGYIFLRKHLKTAIRQRNYH